MKICVKCNKQSPDEDNFCRYCGEKLTSVAAQNTEIEAGDTKNGGCSVFLKYSSFLDNAVLYRVALGKEQGLVSSAPGEVEEIYRVLAFRGYPDGMYKYAEICLNSNPPDRLTAHKWLKIAADAGHAASRIKLQTENWGGDAPQNLSVGASGTGYDYNSLKINTRDAERNNDFVSENRNIQLPAEGGSFVERVKEVLPSILSINAVFKSGRNKMLSKGSGFLVQGGYVITNAHVVGESPECIEANFEPSIDKRTYNLMPLAILPELDIAVLCFTGNIGEALSSRKLLSLRTEGVTFGEEVYTVGNPLGIGLSVSKGVVSSPNRKTDYPKNVDFVIQTDMTVNHGNSGGALLDAANNVIGVITFYPGKSEGGIAMCVPAIYIKNVLERINN
ncbi:MAG: trypsin-like peptidase domain-containing protein [Clostridia bacterium]|nr:trypsin-like peptidase domain-containing protein [Clostridia bacterium]